MNPEYPLGLRSIGAYVTLSLLALLASCSSDPKDTSERRDPGDSCPIAVVTPEELSWAEIALGMPTTDTVSVVNNCADGTALSVIPSVSNADFVVSPDPFSIESGEVAVIDVTVTPRGYADIVGTLILTTNAPGQSKIVVALVASVEADVDNDGFATVEAGGDDCNDADADIFPGAPDTWYDGIDSDCAGDDDYDQDGDGYGQNDVVYDCDDEDSTVHPGADEVEDGKDNDCNQIADFQVGTWSFLACASSGTSCDHEIRTTPGAVLLELFTTQTDDPALYSEYHDEFVLEYIGSDGRENYNLHLEGVTEVAEVGSGTTMFYYASPDSTWYIGVTQVVRATDRFGVSRCKVYGDDPTYFADLGCEVL